MSLKEQLEELFNIFDADKSGKLNEEEVASLLRTYAEKHQSEGEKWSDEKCAEMAKVRTCDKCFHILDNNNQVHNATYDKTLMITVNSRECRPFSCYHFSCN